MSRLYYICWGFLASVAIIGWLVLGALAPQSLANSWQVISLQMQGTTMDASNYTGTDQYLKAEDLGSRQPELTIESIEVETFGEEKASEHKLALYFKGREKGIISNKTNTKRLVEKFGAETDKWIGKKIRASQNHTPLGVGFTLTPIDPKDDDFDDDIPF